MGANMATNAKPISIAQQQVDHDSAAKAFPVALEILGKWKCSVNEKMVLLGFTSRSTFNYAAKDPDRFQGYGPDLLERMSYIINIHKSLRILYSLEDSQYGWVRKLNSEPFFAGRSAMEVMMNGRMIDLWQVASRLHAWRGGQS